jgi:hypothetical protein
VRRNRHGEVGHPEISLTERPCCLARTIGQNLRRSHRNLQTKAFDKLSGQNMIGNIHSQFISQLESSIPSTKIRELETPSQSHRTLPGKYEVWAHQRQFEYANPSVSARKHSPSIRCKSAKNRVGSRCDRPQRSPSPAPATRHPDPLLPYPAWRFATEVHRVHCQLIRKNVKNGRAVGPCALGTRRVYL